LPTIAFPVQTASGGIPILNSWANPLRVKFT
jgi:hypothetical protein